MTIGGLPYLGASATTVYLAHQAGVAASGLSTSIDPGVALTILDQALNFQVTYGAVLLTFLGLSLQLLENSVAKNRGTNQAPCTGEWRFQRMVVIKGICVSL